MKHFSLLLFLALSICCANTTLAANKDGRILFYARLSAAQEVPAVATKAKGLVTFTLEEDYKTMTVFGVFDSLSGAPTACHLHAGAAGANGGVILDLFSLVSGNKISGRVTVTKAILAAIASGVYINVHTSANQGGEMRGQLRIEADYLTVGFLAGRNEVPAVTSNGVGFGTFTLSTLGSKLDYKVQVTGLSGAITVAHLHYGASGSAGAVAYPLAISGTTLTGSIAVSSAFVDSLFAGKVYVNVHTATNPSGEIRSQLLFTPRVAFDVTAIGANEVPATVSSGKALGAAWLTPSLDSMDYYVLYDSIAPTMAHFHVGVAGANGAVIIGLTPLVGTPNVYSNRVAVLPDTLARILKGGIYLNMHTTTNPNGEIRGQTNTIVREGLVANLCGKQEVPAVNVLAQGAGILSIDRSKSDAHIEVLTTGLSSNALQGHLHIGAKGANGGVFVDLGITGATGNASSGYFTFSRTTLADTLISGLGYYNVHTAANTGGEIRGQLDKILQPECLTVGTFDLENATIAVKVYPNPMTDEVRLDFDSPSALETQVIISDLLGRTVLTKNTSVLSGENQIVLNVNQLNRGIYFIQLRTNGRILLTEKVVKN